MTPDSHAHDQETLGRAIEGALAGEDKALGQQVRELGDQLVRLLTGLWRLMRTHDPANHAFDQPVHELEGVLARLIELLGPVQLVCVEGQIYINDVRIRMDERLGGLADLEEELRRHHAGGISFEEPLNDHTIREMLPVLAAKPAAEAPLRALATGLKSAGIRGVGVNGLYRLRLHGEDGAQAPTRPQKDVQETLHRAAGLVANAWENLAAARTPNPVGIRRLINDIVDGTCDADQLLEQDRAAGVGAGAAHTRHAVRVASLAVIIGGDLGLNQAALADLGVAAMFHDVGYGAREDGMAPPFSRHASAGARMLLRQRGFHPAKIKRLLSTYEHHAPLAANPILLSRIIHIADDFDTLTRLRPGGPLYSPAHALEVMHAATGKLYDPGLFQVLVNHLGKYPPGTLLKLRDGRWVVSISGARSPNTFARPLCRVLRGADGQAVVAGPDVDLALGGAIAEVVPGSQP